MRSLIGPVATPLDYTTIATSGGSFPCGKLSLPKRHVANLHVCASASSMVPRRFLLPVIFALVPTALACSGAAEPEGPLEPSSPLPTRTTPPHGGSHTEANDPTKVEAVGRERPALILNKTDTSTMDPKDESPPIADASLPPDALRARTALSRKYVLDASGTVRVHYTPDAAYSPDVPNDVSFEAIQFLGTESPSEVKVEGDFPSNAVVLVTDESFNVLGAAMTRKEGASRPVATMKVAGPGARLILVRDVRWVKPMAFDVHVR